MYRISIVINCFNGEKYLKNAIDSVTNQTYKNWELILWDNHSTDNSKNIFNSYQNKKFIYIKSKKHTTLGEARHLASFNCKGDFICYLDCDDFWEKNYLELQINEFKKNKNISFCYVKTKIVYSNNKSNNFNNIFSFFKKKYLNSSLPSGMIFNKLIFKNFVPLSSALIDKKKFITVGRFDKSLLQCEDYYLFLKLSKNYEVSSINQHLSNYRIHDQNLSNFQLDSDYKEVIYILRKFKKNSIIQIALIFHFLKNLFRKIIIN